MNGYLISFLIFIPLVAALALVFLPDRLKAAFKYIALSVSALQAVAATLLYSGFQHGEGAPAGINTASGFQFVEKVQWIFLDLKAFGKLNVTYFVGVDGMSVMMVMLSVFVMLVGVVSSWNIQEKAKGYFSLYLVLNASVIGCFVALDFFLFYLFFEFMLLPMYFLIGIWGGVRREYASIKFFLYTLLGSIFILVAMIGLYISVIDPAATAVEMGLTASAASATPEIIAAVHAQLANGEVASHQLVRTFDILAMANPANYIPGSLLAISDTMLWGQPVRLLAFLALFIGFAIKVPVVPVHTWLPDAHVEAPTPISVILAGILLKIGGYGLIRTAYTIFPEGAVYYAP